MNLKESRKEYKGGFGKRKEMGETQLNYNHKNKQKKF